MSEVYTPLGGDSEVWRAAVCGAGCARWMYWIADWSHHHLSHQSHKCS